ncbi:MAG: DUF808 domain-containing protein [Promicromonosporaceae bacterium]|nr:DUF808 domain-containing protein [Promicromonosporaceae bacterium]
MSAGLLGLLDDIAAIAKLAAASLDDVAAAAGKATAKAAGVVIDDTAVTPQYVHGVTAERELPIIWKIAAGSLRNKLMIILPAALALSQWAPGWVLPAILVLGGSFLCWEGAHKAWGRRRGEPQGMPVAEQGPDAERRLVKGAIRTDLILSTEIMLIALATVDGPDARASESLWIRAAVLVVVAVAMTAGVYGFVAVLVKMDDMGGALARRARTRLGRGLGRGLVIAMPRLLGALSVVGTVAMLWVGGHLLLQNLAHLGAAFDLGALGWPTRVIEHDVVEPLRAHAAGAGAAVAWLAETTLTALAGIAWGSALYLGGQLIPRRRQMAESSP